MEKPAHAQQKFTHPSFDAINDRKYTHTHFNEKTTTNKNQFAFSTF